jgi:hypothetical protein
MEFPESYIRIIVIVASILALGVSIVAKLSAAVKGDVLSLPKPQIIATKT